MNNHRPILNKKLPLAGNTLRYDNNGNAVIGQICIGTGIGDYAHYIARPTSENDLHGAGAFILMCIEMNLAAGHE
ncbi:glycoside hydrolase family 88 protein [Paenibacillus glycanilyticus]|uniref:glycoside hydrolase family 88 protein n=1 Tax=Paenibacillus glycanilyticus TaxID=126569 RepID=UPI00204116A6|nr:glycoside hydrolase family 88 protein [Paenibacillus glycanilyticus]MCM3626518.1 glycoside hydrolase family 88 protein [Paenibacillus glycanilyticus]